MVTILVMLYLLIVLLPCFIAEDELAELRMNVMNVRMNVRLCDALFDDRVAAVLHS